MSEPFVTKEISNQDIYDLLHKTHDQAVKTNGRVSLLEAEMKKVKKRSFGHWVAEHPFKSTIILTAIVITVISDFRHPIVAFITKLL